MSERWRESVYILVEEDAKGEVSEGWRETVHLFAEIDAKGEVREGWRETVHLLAEINAKGEVREGKRGECRHRFIKLASKSQMSEGGRVEDILRVEIDVDFEVGGKGGESI